MTQQSDLWLLIQAEIESRRQKGLLDYKVPVTADPLVEWLEHAEHEFLDGAVYCRAGREVILKLKRRIAALELTLQSVLEHLPDDVRGKVQVVLEDRA